MKNHVLHDKVVVSDMRELIDAWLFDGGRETYNEYKALSGGGRMLALMTIDSFRDYAEIKVGEKEFFLCHGGINNYDENKPLSEYQTADFVFTREDYSKPKFNKKNKYLVTGHTPTAAIEGAAEGKIFKSHDHIAIDCGAVFGFGLGCLCLDTLEEFYVT
jgi:serine/threonine protein phosphatase 1